MPKKLTDCLASTTDFRRALAVAFWIALLPGLAVAGNPDELHLASDTWPPFTDSAEGRRVAIDLVLTALDRAGISATTTIVHWKDVEAGIRDAKFDGSAAMWRTDKREEYLIFSDPYLENRLVLVGRPGRAEPLVRTGGRNRACPTGYAIDYGLYSRSIQNKRPRALDGRPEPRR